MRRILVTGANKGIGLAIVTAILDEHDDTSVVLGARSAERGRAAIEGLRKSHEGWADRLALLELDVASDASVGSAALKLGEAFGRTPAPLYALVNNAGIGVGAGGMKTVLEVNLLGVRRVCEAFLPLLDPVRGRIVNVGSAAGPSFVATCSPERQRFFLDGQLEAAALQRFVDECVTLASGEHGDKQAFAAKGLGDGDPYGLSKACLNSYTRILAREHPALLINACTPGFIETDLTRPFAQRQGKSPSDMGMKPPSAGARAPMFLLFGQLDGNGRFYGSDAKRSPLDRYRAPGDPPYTGD